MLFYILLTIIVITTVITTVIIIYKNIIVKENIRYITGHTYTTAYSLFSRPSNIPLTPLKAQYKKIDLLDSELKDFFVYNPEYLSPIQDQGSCGSCWAFIVGEVLANQAMILSDGSFHKNLSAQQLLNCYGNKNGCNGESPEEVFLWLEKTQKKLTTNENIPYEQYFHDNILEDCQVINNGISVKKESVRALTKFIPEKKYNPKILEENIKNMKKELILNGPFYSSFTVYSDFFKFKGDTVYEPYTTEKIGGHAILIVGYCNKGIDITPGFSDGYWICKNVWGRKWSKDYLHPGYFCIKMGSNVCGIESRCETVKPNLVDKPVHKKLYFTDINRYYLSNSKN